MQPIRKTLTTFTVLTLLGAFLTALPAAAAVCDEVHVRVAGSDIRVAPTGADDTANLQCALDLAASMPRARVMLDEGVFLTSFLAVEGFHGVFRGAGMDLTTLATLPQGLDCVTQVEETGEPHLITFAGDDVTVRDLTIGVGGETACEAPWSEFIDEDGFGFQAFDVDALVFRSALPVAGVCSPAGEQEVLVDDVRFDGDPNDYAAPVVVFTHIFRGVHAGGFLFPDCPGSRSTGNVVVTDSVFDGPDLGVVIPALDHSLARISRNHLGGAGLGVLTESLSDTRVVVTSNTIDDAQFWGVIGLADVAFVGEDPYSMVIRDNAINTAFQADGVGVLDFARVSTGEPMIDATITRNEIDVGSPFHGVLILEAGGGNISRNSIHGAGEAAVAVFGGAGWGVTRNDVAGFDPFVADIWLDAGTSDNRVACLMPDDTVLDEGTGNVVKGCSSVEPAEPLTATTDAAPLTSTKYDTRLGLRR